MNNVQSKDGRLEVRFYCESCGEGQPVEIEPLRKDNLNGNTAWGDIVCRECHFVIATAMSEMEGILRFISEDEKGIADIAILRAEINDLRQDIKEMKFKRHFGIKDRYGDSTLFKRILGGE